MAVTSISRDEQNNVCLVRMISSDTLATVISADYIADQMVNIRNLNKGFWQWYSTDVILCSASNQNALLIFTNSTFSTLMEYTGSSTQGTVSAALINQLAWYSATGNTVSGLATAANGVLVTSAGSVPSISSTLPAAVQANITALGTIASGVWNGSVIPLTYGGSNAALTASNGGIIYSTATAMAVLAGTATARQMLQSGATAAPAWSTATWPATTTINQILYSSATNTVVGLATGNSSVLVTSAGGVPSLSTTLPSGIAATNMSLTTPSLGVASATSISFGDEALSHYDEGNFIPTVTFGTPGDLSVVYNSRTGTYTRIGRLVFVTWACNFTPTFTTASGSLQLGGLPFTILNDCAGGISYMSGATPPTYPASHTCINIYGNGGTTYSTIASFGSGQNESDLSASNLTSTSQVTIQYSLVFQV